MGRAGAERVNTSKLRLAWVTPGASPRSQLMVSDCSWEEWVFGVDLVAFSTLDRSRRHPHPYSYNGEQVIFADLLIHQATLSQGHPRSTYPVFIPDYWAPARARGNHNLSLDLQLPRPARMFRDLSLIVPSPPYLASTPVRSVEPCTPVRRGCSNGREYYCYAHYVGCAGVVEIYNSPHP